MNKKYIPLFFALITAGLAYPIYSYSPILSIILLCGSIVLFVRTLFPLIKKK